MDRGYLASIVERLATLDARVIGIDYLLDRQQPEKDAILARAVRTAVEEKRIWFIFAAILDAGERELGVGEQTGITDLNWSLQGYTNALPQYVKLPTSENCQRTCPFTYLLAMVWALHQEPLASNLPQPQLGSQEDFRTQVFDYVNNQNNHNDTVIFLSQARLSPVTELSQSFGQFWLRPIIDFSIPPNLVYESLAAWQLLNGNDELEHYQFDQQIVIIAPGGYEEAGVSPGADNFPLPLAVAYWRERLGLAAENPQSFTGSEFNAYMVHHLLTQRLVIAIPDLWAIALAGLLGKGVTLILRKRYRQRQRWRLGLTGATAVYGLVGLPVYLAAGVLLPWFFPSAVFLVYVWSFSRNKDYE